MQRSYSLIMGIVCMKMTHIMLLKLGS